MNKICESCKHKNIDDKFCYHGYNQHTGRKEFDKTPIICERYSRYLKKLLDNLKKE